MPVTVITAGIHDVPAVGGQRFFIVRAVLGVIEIRQAHHMTELMAQRSDAAEGLVVSQLIRAGVVIDIFASHDTLRFGVSAAIFGTVLAVLIAVRVRLARRSNIPVMRPYSVRRTAVGLTLAGIDHEHLIHLSVVIPVVVGKVHLFIGLF